MNLAPAMKLVALMLLAYGGALSFTTGSAMDAPSEGATSTFHFSTPMTEAYMMRFRVDEAKCFAVTMTNEAGEQKLPYARVFADGETFQSPTGAVDVTNGVSPGLEYDSSGRSTHTRVNVTVGRTTVYASESESREDLSASRFLPSRYFGCNMDPRDIWIFVMATGTNTTVDVEFYEEGDGTNPRATFRKGNASAVLTFLSTSSRTFTDELRDFKGTISHSGPLQGIGPQVAAGVNLETSFHATRGFVGGMVDPMPVAAGGVLLSYVGPNGEAGVGSESLPLLSASRYQTLFMQGSAGDWRFNAHLYAAPRPASLFVWGADIQPR